MVYNQLTIKRNADGTIGNTAPVNSQYNLAGPALPKGNVGSLSGTVKKPQFEPAKNPTITSNVGATNPTPTTITPPSLKTPAAQEFINGLPINVGSTQSSPVSTQATFSGQATPTSIPSQPAQPSATDTAFAAYLKSLQPSEEVTKAKTAYNDYVASAELGIKGKEGQGRGIPLQLVRGQQAKLADQAEIEAKRLQGDISIAQDANTQLQNANKANFEYLSGKDKPIEVGSALIKLNPATGKYETVYEAPIKPEAKPASVQEYEYAKGQGYTGTYQDYQNEDANRKALASSVIGANGLNPAQTQNFLRISDKYQADEIIKNGDKAISANAIADQVLANPGNAGNQLKILYTLVKNLDPDSAVREGELDLASKIQSYTGKFSTSLARISEGKLLDERATKELANATKDLAQVWVEAMNRRNKQYDSQAMVSGIGDAWNQYKTGFGSTQTTPSTGTGADDLINKYLPGFNQAGNASASNFTGPIQLGSNLARLNNNPGNLRFVGQAGATQGSGGFARFPTPEAGVQALKNQIKLDASRGLTLQSFINKYAPPVENNTSLYVQQAVKNLGVSPNTPLKNIDLNKITKFMALKESSSKIG